MKTPVLSVYLFLFLISAKAQNLVPNAGFEQMRKMPVKNNSGINCAKNWGPPTYSGSDYYHRDAERHVGTPRNVFGRQKPHSGKAYAGICIRNSYVEYIGTKLNDTLKKDQDYLVELYISRADRSLTKVKEFGVLLTNKLSQSIDDKGLAFKPSVDFTKPFGGYRKKIGWTKLSGVYHAEGNETVIVLGYFNYARPKGYRGFCHYYIDDVSVTAINNKEEKKEDEPVEIIPAEEPVTKTFSPKAGETITLKNIFFVSNKSELLPTSFSELDKLVQYLNEEENTSIKISGHTDKTGSENINKILSEARAKAVANYLTEKGIDETRINYTGYGSSKPIAGNDTEQGKQQNRRVEFVINKR